MTISVSHGSLPSHRTTLDRFGIAYECQRASVINHQAHSTREGPSAQQFMRSIGYKHDEQHRTFNGNAAVGWMVPGMRCSVPAESCAPSSDALPLLAASRTLCWHQNLSPALSVTWVMGWKTLIESAQGNKPGEVLICYEGGQPLRENSTS